MSALPEGRAHTLARIIGHEGTPEPERWHFLAYDPESESGVREYVVTKGELVASRQLSQFASTLKPGDMLGKENVKLDSAQAAQVARDFAIANDALIARIDYDLKKEGEEAAPMWRLTCYDESGKTIGELQITSGKGTVIAHNGFAKTPAAREEKFESAAQEAVATSGTQSATDETANQNLASNDEASKKPEQDSKKKGVSHGFRKVGGSLQKFFTGKDTISR